MSCSKPLPPELLRGNGLTLLHRAKKWKSAPVSACFWRRAWVPGHAGHGERRHVHRSIERLARAPCQPFDAKPARRFSSSSKRGPMFVQSLSGKPKRPELALLSDACTRWRRRSDECGDFLQRLLLHCVFGNGGVLLWIADHHQDIGFVMRVATAQLV